MPETEDEGKSLDAGLLGVTIPLLPDGDAGPSAQRTDCAGEAVRDCRGKSSRSESTRECRAEVERPLRSS
jgi:hypothetical protein